SEQFLEIPGAGQGVGSWVETMLVLKSAKMLRVGPFAGGVLADLHEADLIGAATDVGMEAALSPDDGFDKRGLDLVTGGRGANRLVLAAFELSMSKEDDQGEQQCD